MGWVPVDAEISLAHDVDLQDALPMSLLVCVQTALGIALHVAAAEGLGVPRTYVEGSRILPDLSTIDGETARRPVGMAALRYRIARGCAAVDFERVWSALPIGLEAFDRAVTRHLSGPAR